MGGRVITFTMAEFMVFLAVIITFYEIFSYKMNYDFIGDALADALDSGTVKIFSVLKKILLRDKRIFLYVLMTSLASKLALIEIGRIAVSISGQVEPLKIIALEVSLSIVVINFILSSCSRKIVGIEKRKAGYLDLIEVAAPSVLFIFLYEAYLFKTIKLPMIYVCPRIVLCVIFIKKFIDAYIAIWCSYLIGKTIVYEQELVKVHPINPEKYHIVLINRNNREFILDPKTSLKLNQNVVGNITKVDIKLKKSRIFRSMVITDLW